MRIIVTGATGMLGSALCSFMKDKADIIPLAKDKFDLSNSSNFKEAIAPLQADAIIHTAALTHVDYCEAHKDEAYRVNVEGTKDLVSSSMGKKTKFIYISSTGIYGNYQDSPFSEADPIRPTTIYHQSKYAGEQAVLANTDNFLIIRTGWLFGGAKSHKKNFVYQRFLDLQNKDLLYADTSQNGCPTFVQNLAKQIFLLIEKNIRGIFNCVDHGVASRYDYVKEIAQLFASQTRVEKAPTGYFSRLAKVSHNETATNDCLHQLGLDVMRPWRQSLADYIELLKKGGHSGEGFSSDELL